MTLFDGATALLVGLVLVEGVALQNAVKRLARDRRAVRAERDRLQAFPSGTPAPSFALPVVGEGLFRSPADLKAGHSILLFLPVLTTREAAIDAAIHAMWVKADGCLRVVCHGSPLACARMEELYELGRRRVPMLIDESAHVAELLRIQRLPEAVEFDGDAALVKYGRQVGGERWPTRPHVTGFGGKGDVAG
jgi:hypothetical protein